MEKLTAQDGLYSNRLFKTYRDNSGYLWIAGINGVAKYDGFHVVNYTEHSDSLNRYIRGNRFYDVIQDKSNHIWVGGSSGLHKLDASENTFKQVAPNTIKNVQLLHLLNDSTLGVSCGNKRNYEINCTTNSFVETSEGARITSVIVDNSGSVWKSTSDGLIIYDDQDTVLDFETAVSDICFTPNGDLYVGTSNGLIIVPQSELGKENKALKRITESGEKYKLTNNDVTTVEYYQGQLWVGTRVGLNLLQLNKNGQISEILHLYNQPNDPYSLSNNQINDIYTDSEGIIWLSTYGGLNKIDPQHLWFSSYRYNPEDPNSLHDNNIFPIDGDTLGNVWFGSYRNGLAKLNTRTNIFTAFNSKTGVDIKHVRYIYTDNKNSIWIVADNKLFLTGNTDLSSVNIIDKAGENYPHGFITAIVQHPDGNYWMGIGEDIVELERISERGFQVLHVYTEDIGYVIRFFVDSFGRIWGGTNKGLLLIKPEKGTFLKFDTNNQPAFRTNQIQAINQDSNGNLWLGSVDGLYKVANDSIFQNALEKIKFQGFFEENGLTHNYVSGILPGEKGALWLSSWKGIMKYDPECIRLCRFIPFTFSDGLIDEKYNRNAIYRDKKTNTYYFGSVNGVNYFNPLKEFKTMVLPHVLINRVVLNGDLVEVNNNESEIVATIRKRRIIDQLKVEFGSSSLLSPNKQVFAWKLEGQDKKWTFTRNRELVIKDITPGAYTLKIRAASKEGNLGAPVFIPVVVRSNFRWYVIFGLLIILTLGLVLSLRNNKHEIEPKPKEKKYEFSKLTDDKSAQTAKRLSEIMRDDKPFLQADLTADKLAKMVDISVGELSQILNEYLQTRFYEYVNKHRVKEFICLLQTPEAEKLTLTALSEKCGFTSKSTFYRAFKNEKGITPAQFAKSLKEKS
ncbi:two-component regulator propeller domain-containing protein [Saccharicrinis sp. GN24d3]|uniref:two-component regulator propeller domain-containing protein n=1 Tax=Saccharicrinis sp. GN24d3 TaxID=3458416 RepID=UPI0040372055